MDDFSITLLAPSWSPPSNPGLPRQSIPGVPLLGLGPIPINLVPGMLSGHAVREINLVFPVFNLPAVRMFAPVPLGPLLVQVDLVAVTVSDQLPEQIVVRTSTDMTCPSEKFLFLDQVPNSSRVLFTTPSSPCFTLISHNCQDEELDYQDCQIPREAKPFRLGTVCKDSRERRSRIVPANKNLPGEQKHDQNVDPGPVGLVEHLVVGQPPLGELHFLWPTERNKTPLPKSLPRLPFLMVLFELEEFLVLLVVDPMDALELLVILPSLLVVNPTGMVCRPDTLSLR